MNFRLTIRNNDRSLVEVKYFETEEDMGVEILKWDEGDYILVPQEAEWINLTYNILPPTERTVRFF